MFSALRQYCSYTYFFRPHASFQLHRNVGILAPSAMTDT